MSAEIDADLTGHNWRQHPDRPCKGRTSEWFLVGVPVRVRSREVKKLVSECMTCPVLKQCEKDALQIGSSGIYGVQGGMSQRTRKLARR